MARSRSKSLSSKNGTQAPVDNETTTRPRSPSRAPQHRNGNEHPPQSDVTTRIQLRAYQLFEQRGRGHGHDVRDWLEAEQLTLAEREAES